MGLKFQPKPRMVLICDFRGFEPPEMVKRRPVVVVASNPDRDQMVTVVPLSKSPLSVIAPGTTDSQRLWFHSQVARPSGQSATFSGVFAPHSRWRAEVTPAGRGTPTTSDPRTPAERHRAMTWAQRLKRVFGIEIETCEQCGARPRAGSGFTDQSAEPVRPGITGPGVGGCAEQGPRCTNPALTGRFAGPWVGAAGRSPARRPWRPGSRAGRLRGWGV